MIKENVIPEVNAYLEAVRQEIEEKSIQESLLLELYQHMEDSATLQIESGMPVNEAWNHTLSAMGDAHETGKKLNRVHRKRNPVFPLLVVGISILIALITGFVINNQKRTIIGLMLACVIILSFTYLGHNFLRSRKLFLVTSAILFLIAIAASSHTLLFAFCMFCAPVLAYMEIRQSRYTSYASIMVYTVVILICKYPYGTYTLTSAFILTISFCSVILYSSLNTAKSKCTKILLVIALFLFMYYPHICLRWETYIKAFSTESTAIFSSLGNVRFVGKAFHFEGFIRGLSGHYANYRILYYVLSYGIMPAVLMLFLACGMYLVLFRCIKMLSNHTHRMLAISCFSCLFMQFILYFLGNFGLLFLCFPALPILSEGLSSIIINAFFIGIILNLYQYDRALSVTF